MIFRIHFCGQSVRVNEHCALDLLAVFRELYDANAWLEVTA